MSIVQKRILTIKHNYDMYHDMTQTTPTIQIDLQHSKTILKQNIQPELYNLLIKYKSHIDNNIYWNKVKKISNIFEYIYIYNKHVDNNIGTALYNPISRSFFKLQEIICDLDLLQTESKALVIVGLAEAPGGFIECMYQYRRKQFVLNKDEYFCMSLLSSDTDVPLLQHLKHKIKYNTLTLLTGEDGSGDLYNYKNIIHLKKSIGKKVDIVTADGGFNYDDQYDYQEQLSYKLIFSEMISALHILKKGGHFVLKIFDIFTHNTCNLIYFISTFFEEVYITKPFSSRPANSEKYVVCKHFRGMSEEYGQTLLETLLDWNVINHNHKFVTNIFNITTTPTYTNIMKGLYEYNIMFVKNQIKNILTTLTYIEYHLSEQDKIKIYHIQASVCFFWCLKYKLELNYRCKYLK